MSETTMQQRRFWVREEVTYRLYLTLNRAGTATQDDVDAAVAEWKRRAAARGAQPGSLGEPTVTLHHPMVAGPPGHAFADSAQFVVTGLITLDPTP